MRTSIEWLNDYVTIQTAPQELADALTMAGIPVEEIEYQGQGLEKVVVGKIEEILPHPNADKLRICRVNVGAAELLQIVTGAANVQEKDVIPVALEGAHLPNGVSIKASKLRGEPSYGMLCSAKELGIDSEELPEEQRSGIYILPADTAIGQGIQDVLGLNQVILGFELTANRPDCFSVIGLAREVAALTGTSLKLPEIKVQEDSALPQASETVTVQTACPDLCRRFAARVLHDVKVGPSPEWMARRVEAAGMRSISNVVDVTNFVMLEMGQPLHAYDASRVRGASLTARLANEGEELVTLDSAERKLNPSMLVIADAEGPAGLAGVMGGFDSEVTAATQTVILEAAHFQGANIRRTARQLGLRSEASGRFERGTDVVRATEALDRAAQLLLEMGACRIAPGYADAYPVVQEPRTVSFSVAEVNRRLGTALSADCMNEILQRLYFTILQVEGDIVTLGVPSWRDDVEGMADISEEIARMHGFEQIQASLPAAAVAPGGQSQRHDLVDLLTQQCVAAGFMQGISFSFSHPKVFDALRLEEEDMRRQAVPVLNPITDEFPILRTTLLGNMLEMVGRNVARRNEDVRLFEIGAVYLPKNLPMDTLPQEPWMLCAALTGRRQPQGWNQGQEPVDFYDAKGLAEQLLHSLGLNKAIFEKAVHPALHPGRCARIVYPGGKELGWVGEVHPDTREAFGLRAPVFVCELSLEAMLPLWKRLPIYTALPKFPGMQRDLAFVTSDEISAGVLEQEISKVGGALLKQVTLFDLYKGEHLPANQRSLAFSLLFQSADKTLTDEEVEAVIQKIISRLHERFGCELRQ